MSEIKRSHGRYPWNQSVAIYDLRGLDAWNYDWCLVIADMEENTNTTIRDIAYLDTCGDMVFYDGSEAGAKNYFSEYCYNHHLTLVDKETMSKIRNLI